MKPLRIRQWMFLGLLIILVVPRLFYEIPGVLNGYVFEDSSSHQSEMNALLSEATNNPSKWKDRSFRETLRNQSQKKDMSILILNSSEHVIFRSGPVESIQNPDTQATVVQGGKILGRVLLFAPAKSEVLPTLLAILSALCAFLFIGYKMGRYVVKPLEAMGHAARQIAGGDLNFELPKSSAAEVEDVRAAFEAMGKGLRNSITKQSKLEEERRVFIGAIAHDLRTPLFVLRGFLMRLSKGLTTEPNKVARYVTICSQKAEQLDRLVSDLLSYTKMDRMEQTLQNHVLEIKPLIDEVLEDFRSIAKAKQIEFYHEAPNTTCTLHGDRHLLIRVLVNLLENAIRYTPAGGNIEFKCQITDDLFIFTVEDTGPGITQSDLPYLFEPFYRAEGSRNRGTGGIGLGLTIARRILRAHEGDLTAENRTSGGARFKGWIPLHFSSQIEKKQSPLL